MSQLNDSSWICPRYFQEILVKTLKNSSIKVREIKLEPCGAAQGFLSTLLRVHVSYCMNSTDLSESFILKMPTTQEVAVEKVGVNGYDVQNKEMRFFEVIAPQMKKILKIIDDDHNVLPKVVAVDRVHDVIVLEDLRDINFVMVDRLTGLDQAHVILSLKKLAKFQAASLILYQKHPNVFDSFDSGFYSRKMTVFNDGLLSVYELVVEEVKTWAGFEIYAAKMKKIKQSVIERVNRCFDVGSDEFCVLNHGDLWTSNLMFTCNDGVVTDAILIDFQFCHWGSPVLDLIHFLYTSLADELHTQEKIEEFVQIFYNELKEMLIKLDYDLNKFPELNEFQRQFFGKLFYGFVYTLLVFPIMTSDDVDNDFIAHHSRDERATNFKKRVLKSQKYQRIVKKLLPVYDRLGLLEEDFSSPAPLS